MRPELTVKEHAIAIGVMRGMTNREIAKEIGHTFFVTKNLMRPIYEKSGMSNRLELALWYLHHFEMK